MILVLTGCEALNEAIERLTNPKVAETVFLGVSAPDDIDLSGTAWASGSTVTVFVADRDEDGNVTGVTGADVALSSGSMGTAALLDAGGGNYSGSAEEGVAYTEDELVSSWWDGEEVLQARTVPPADVDVPEEVSPGDTFDLSVDPDVYEALIVSVVDLTTGTTTFENTPRTATEMYDFATGGAATTVTVPTTAFPGQSAYALGVAGLSQGDSDDTRVVNELFSVMLVGTLEFYAVSTL
jgi:hypothetical protein